MAIEKVTVFTDGASRGNPGPGGWAFIVTDGQKVQEGGGREEHTTNNRMEMKAALEAMKYVHKQYDDVSRVIIHSDSAYVINGVTKWLSGWQKNNWTTKTKEPVKNEDVWREIAEIVKTLNIEWVRVSGHVGVPGNERVDEIATQYADGKTANLFSGLYVDYGKDLSKIESAHIDTEKVKKKQKNMPAYSYVSSVGGEVRIHQTWAECERRVKGVAARYKKAVSKEDEESIVAEFRALSSQ